MSRASAFAEARLQGQRSLTSSSEMQELYLADDVPWVVGYSGGKDSTAVLQLVWLALQRARAERAHQAGARDQHRHAGREPGRRRVGDALARRHGGRRPTSRDCRSRRTGSRRT